MASTVAVLLLLSAGLFTVAVGLNCQSYYTSGNVYKPSISCGFLQHCCGTCDHRYCCSSDYFELDQDFCNISGNYVAAIVSVTVAIVVICIVCVIVCCCCPCCCIYKMWKTPRTVVGTHVTTVMNTQCIQQQQQQPVMQGAQTQPGYGGQPMQTVPYQGQPYAPGPPPPYHMATSPGYPSGQAAYGRSQATHPMLPPAQPDPAHLHPETFKQPAYNPAYMQPPNTGY